MVSPPWLSRQAPSLSARPLGKLWMSPQGAALGTIGSKPGHLADSSARSRRQAAVGAAVLGEDHHEAVRIGGKRHHVCRGVGAVLGPAVEQAAPPDLVAADLSNPIDWLGKIGGGDGRDL